MKGLKRYIFSGTFTIVFILSFFNITIFYEKISSLYASGLEIEYVITRAFQTASTYSGGRFGGFYIAWQDFKRYPLLGRGGLTELTYGSHGFGRVYIVSGLAEIMAQYGLFGLIVFFTFLIKSSHLTAKVFNSKASLGLFIVIIISSLSFATHNQIILFTLMFSSFYGSSRKSVILR